MRFEEDFNYLIHVNEEVEDSFKIPSMLIQPYVENAIKHGLLHKKGPKKLELHFYKKDFNLIVEVIDNGIGLEASLKLNAARNKKHTPFATKANQLRLELLNANSKGIIGVETVELKNESEQVIGTKVIIKIPSDL
jgi:LytS/YehU family sensor histidine kinase